MQRLHHPSVLILLSIGLVATVAIGSSGHYHFYSKQGILSGPFSAILLLGAGECALFLIVLLDWKVWLPRRKALEEAVNRWMAVSVLGNSMPPDPGWKELKGRFRGHDITITRSSCSPRSGLKWSARTAANVSVRIIRLLDDSSIEPADPAFFTGDPHFDKFYAWQTPFPEKVLPLLKDNIFRTSLKRLAGLYATRGRVSDSQAGVNVQSGTIDIVQKLGPALQPGSFSANEILSILHDLSIFASHLEHPNNQTEAEYANPTIPLFPGSSNWIKMIALALVILSLWFVGMYFAACLLGMPAAMVAFFIPLMVLAFWFMRSAGGSGREPELDDAIRKEAREIVMQFKDLFALAKLAPLDI